MKNTKHTWLCSYDIRHAKRLAQMHDLLSKQGVAINFSVFYVRLDDQQYQQLCKAIEKIISKEDDVRLYRCIADQKFDVMCNDDLTLGLVKLL